MNTSINTGILFDEFPLDVVRAPVGHTIQDTDWVRNPQDFFRWIHPKASVGRKVLSHEHGYVMTSFQTN